jgi:hypothetical protein
VKTGNEYSFFGSVEILFSCDSLPPIGCLESISPSFFMPDWLIMICGKRSAAAPRKFFFNAPHMGERIPVKNLTRGQAFNGEYRQGISA